LVYHLSKLFFKKKVNLVKIKKFKKYSLKIYKDILKNIHHQFLQDGKTDMFNWKIKNLNISNKKTLKFQVVSSISIILISLLFIIKKINAAFLYKCWVINVNLILKLKIKWFVKLGNLKFKNILIKAMGKNLINHVMGFINLGDLIIWVKNNLYLRQIQGIFYYLGQIKK